MCLVSKNSKGSSQIEKNNTGSQNYIPVNTYQSAVGNHDGLVVSTFVSFKLATWQCQAFQFFLCRGKSDRSKCYLQS